MKLSLKNVFRELNQKGKISPLPIKYPDLNQKTGVKLRDIITNIVRYLAIFNLLLLIPGYARCFVIDASFGHSSSEFLLSVKVISSALT